MEEEFSKKTKKHRHSHSGSLNKKHPNTVSLPILPSEAFSLADGSGDDTNNNATGSDMSLTSLSPPTSAKSKTPTTENDALSSLSSPSIVVTQWTSSEPLLQSNYGNTMPLVAGGMRRASSTGHDRMIFVDYKDGLLNQNRKSFDSVSFCFRCDKKYDMRRSRSTSSIGRVSAPLDGRIEKTGEKFRFGEMIPVYRTVFLCIECVTHIETLKKSALSPITVRISSLAMTYF